MPEVKPLFDDEPSAQQSPASAPSLSQVPQPGTEQSQIVAVFHPLLGVVDVGPSDQMPHAATIGQSRTGMSNVPDSAIQNTACRVPMLPGDADLDKLIADARGTYSSITQKLLETHKASDAGDMGKGINEMLLAAKGLDPKNQPHSLLGKMLSAVRGEKETILAHTQSVQKRLNELSAQLQKTANLMRQRITDLEGLKKENLAHQERLQTGIANAQNWLQQVQSILAQPPANPQDMQEAAQRKATQHLLQRLQATIPDLQNALVLDQQQQQELQTTQDNARAILDEFERVQNIAIPALTSLVTQQLIALEQKQAINTDAAIRDMTNAAILQAAQTLGENEVQVAQLQSQSVISVDTLTQAQDVLDQAEKKVQEIQAQAEIQRREDAAKRADLERRLLGSS